MAKHLRSYKVVSSARPRRRKAAAFAAVVVAAGLSGLIPVASSASQRPATNPYSYFKGQTINFVCPNTAGTGICNAANAVVPSLASILGATINIQYVGGASTVGLDIVGSSAPNGLTLGILATATTMQAEFLNQGSPNFALRAASYLGGTLGGPSLFVACTGATFSTWQQVVQGNIPLTVLDTTGGSNELIHFLMSAYPVPHKSLTGYTPASSLAGCIRGDGNFGGNSLAQWVNAAGTAMTPGITPLLLSGTVPKAAPEAFLNKQVPTLQQFEAKHPPKTPFAKQAAQLAIDAFSQSAPQWVFFGPPGISKAHLAALQEATKAAFKLAVVKQGLLRDGVPPGYTSPTAALNYFKTQVKKQALSVRALNS